ncbi:MAG: hypothetical protein AAB038_04020 [Planctomycetota bacterium]
MTYRRTYFTNAQVTTPQITESAVTEDKIANDAVTSPKIKNATIRSEDIADKAVTLAKLGDDVPAVGIPDGSIGVEKLKSSSVTKDKIATGAVDTDELAAASVTTEKIRDANVTGVKIAANAITTGKIATGAVGTTDIANGAVTPEKLSFSVPSRPLTPPVTTAEIGDGQVTQAKLAPGVGGGDTLTMLPVPATALDQGGIVATTAPATVDLSTIIPLNTKGVIVSIACINQSYANGGMMAYIFRQLGAEYALQVMAPAVNAPGISNGGSVLMPVATDRTLLWQAYVSGNNSTELVIYILGYVV